MRDASSFLSMADGFRPFEHGAMRGNMVSSFWDVKEQKRDPLVLDAGRHRQVQDAGAGLSASGQVHGLSTLDATLSSLREDQQRMTAYAQPRGLQVRAADTQSSAFAGMSLDVSSNVAVQPQLNVAEMSSRRRDAIKAAFRRLEKGGQGWVTVQDMIQGLQRFSNLPDFEKERVVLGLCGGGALGRGLSRDANTRVTFSMFASYYQLIGSSIERDRDFEDLLRYHWGFSEVSDIMDDMKNKFAMVGLAYAFRRNLEGGSSPELTPDAFEQALGHVGMKYSGDDILRLFQAFGEHTSSGGQTMEILRLTQHLTSAPRPPTPITSLPGMAHISEVHSTPDASTTAGQRGLGFDQSSSSLSFSQHLSQHQMPSYKVETYSQSPFGTGYGLSEKLGPTSLAPPEGGAVGRYGNVGSTGFDEWHWPLPMAPSEDTHANLAEMPDAPPERDGYGKLPLADTTEAPPEDDDGELAPEETDPPESGEMPDAPKEKDPYDYRHSSYMQNPSHLQQGSFGQQMQNNYGPGVGNFGSSSSPAVASQHQMPSIPSQSVQPVQPATSQMQFSQASSSSVRLQPRGQRKAVTVGINYIGSEYQLAGCINDSDTLIELLTEDLGYSVSDIRQLRDDHPQRMPTRKNILAAMNWLVKNAQPGDHLFFHYSGHGSQQPDTSGDEIDRKDETIVPCDFKSHGMLADDDLRRLLVEPLPQGCRLTVLMDCCHSGTGMDLAYQAKVLQDGSISINKKASNLLPRPAHAEVVMLSGCKDSQTSADVSGGVAGNKAAGAMTTAFKSVISKRKDASYHDLLLDVLAFLKQNGFVQVPQLCMESHINFEEPFLPEASPLGVPASVPSSTRPPQRRALTIGINYLSLPDGQGRLSGCINDSETIISVLKEVFRFDDTQICRLRDDRANMMPTKANILASMQWLTQGAASGDELFLHYSGHGGQVKDTSGDEVSGMDDTLIPCDFQSAGQITDDELYSLVVEHLPKGCRLWVVLDCCHSGTALDLPYKAQLSPDGRRKRCARVRTPFRRPSGRPVSQASEAEVIMLSGCKDDQTSADISSASIVQRASGAMTTAFRQVISPTITCEDLLAGMCNFLKRNGFAQVPQLTSEHFIQFDSAFVNYETVQRHKQPSTGFVHQQMSATRDLFGAGNQLPSSMSPVPSHMPGSPMPSSPMHQPHREVAAVDSRIHRLEEQIMELKHQQLSPMRGAVSPMPQHAPPSPMAGAGIWHSGMSMPQQHGW